MNQPNRKGPGNAPAEIKTLMGIVSIILWALIITLMINYFTSSMSPPIPPRLSIPNFWKWWRTTKWPGGDGGQQIHHLPRPEAAAEAQDAQTSQDGGSAPSVTPLPGLEGLEGLTGGGLIGGAETPAESSASQPGFGSSEWKRMLQQGPSYYCSPILTDTAVAELTGMLMANNTEENPVLFGPPYIEQLSPSLDC